MFSCPSLCSIWSLQPHDSAHINSPNLTSFWLVFAWRFSEIVCGRMKVRCGVAGNYGSDHNKTLSCWLLETTRNHFSARKPIMSMTTLKWNVIIARRKYYTQISWLATVDTINVHLILNMEVPQAMTCGVNSASRTNSMNFWWSIAWSRSKHS